jgi:hypothetical protein
VRGRTSVSKFHSLPAAMTMGSLMPSSMTTSLAMTVVFVVGMFIVYRDLRRLEVVTSYRPKCRADLSARKRILLNDTLTMMK